MDFEVFKQNLRSLNQLLYVDMNHRVFTQNPLGTSGIYIRSHFDDPIDVSVLSGDERRIGEAYNASPDRYLTWVTHQSVPEGDKYDENGKPTAKGWRSIVRGLVKQRHVRERKAQKVFGWYLSDYDLMEYPQKLEFERKYGSDHGIHT